MKNIVTHWLCGVYDTEGKTVSHNIIQAGHRQDGKGNLASGRNTKLRFLRGGQKSGFSTEDFCFSDLSCRREAVANRYSKLSLMEKVLKPHDKEHMKMAMLKHEETFKQQIYELHRLYRIQKILMKGVENIPEKPNHQRLNSSKISLNHTNRNLYNFQQKAQPGLNLGRPVEEYSRELNGDKIEGESEIKLTLGPTMHHSKKKSEISDSGTCFSSSSTGSSQIIKGAHQGQNQKQENPAWGLTMVTPDSNYRYHGTKKNYYCVQDQSRQGSLNQPAWLSQALSLNMSYRMI